MLSGLLDVVLLFVSFLLANYVRFNYVVFFEPGGAGPALQVAGDPRNFIAGAGTSVLLVLAYWVAGVYSSSRLRGLAQRCSLSLPCCGCWAARSSARPKNTRLIKISKNP